MLKVATTLEIAGGLVVGQDGSPASDEAVRWAARLAARLGTPLHVVRAWTISSAPRPATASAGYVPPLTDFEAAVLERLQRDIAALELDPAADVRFHVLHGPAGRRMVDASPQAEMLVIGSRGAGGFLGLSFGSTADQIVRHARCPVVVVPVRGSDHPVELDSESRRD